MQQNPWGLTCRRRGFEAAIPGHGDDEFWLNRGYLASGKHTKSYGKWLIYS